MSEHPILVAMVQAYCNQRQEQLDNNDWESCSWPTCGCDDHALGMRAALAAAVGLGWKETPRKMTDAMEDSTYTPSSGTTRALSWADMWDAAPNITKEKPDAT